MAKGYFPTLINQEEIRNKVDSLISSLANHVAAWTAARANKIDQIEQGVIELKKSVSDGKKMVAGAITEKGVGTVVDATFATMATNINRISTLKNETADANANADDLLSGKTAYAKGVKLNGTIPSKGAQVFIPKTYNQQIEAGQYLASAQVIAGSMNLISSNIRQGVDVFGVIGNMQDNTRLMYKDGSISNRGAVTVDGKIKAVLVEMQQNAYPPGFNETAERLYIVATVIPKMGYTWGSYWWVDTNINVNAKGQFTAQFSEDLTSVTIINNKSNLNYYISYRVLYG